MSDLSVEEQERREVELEDKPAAAAAAAAALIDASFGLNCLLATSCLSPEFTTDTTTQARTWMCRVNRKHAHSRLFFFCVVAVFAFCSQHCPTLELLHPAVT